MPLNHPYDGLGLSGNLGWVLDLQERIEAATRPLGAMQKGVEAAMRIQRLTAGMIGSPAWLEAVGLTHTIALSKRMNEAFRAYAVPTLNVPDLSAITRLNTLGPTLPPAVVDLVANLERVQHGFFQNWAELAVAVKQPAWIQEINTLQATFEQLLADLPTDEEEVEEFTASATLRTRVFELGTVILAAPALANSTQFQEVIGEFSGFLAKSTAKDARDWLMALIACLTFIIALRDERRKQQPATATPGEVAIQQELAQNRKQTALLHLNLARQQGEVRITRRSLGLYSRPASKAPKAGRVPAGTELAVTGYVRKWLHVLGFDAGGELQQGWVLAMRLPVPTSAPAEAHR